jgi:Exo-beta-D-glucosaminidase Ig-fold domain
VQMNESTGDVEVINNLPTAVGGAKVRATVYGLDGTVAWQKDFDVEAAGSAATKVGEMAWPEKLSAVHFVKLELRDSAGKMVSENFYWRAQPEHQDDLTALGDMPVVKLEAKVARRDVGGRSFFDVTLTNPGTQIALMAHVQLRGKKSGERVLPIYASDNYVSLIGGETKTITLDAAAVDLKGEDGLAVVDGWNVGLTDASLSGGGVALNVGAQVEHGPVTGLPMISLTQ